MISSVFVRSFFWISIVYGILLNIEGVNSHVSIKSRGNGPPAVIYQSLLSRSQVLEINNEILTQNDVNVTADASFNRNDITLIHSHHENTTVFLLIRGNLTECVNITFTYTPEYPSIEPIENMSLLCPDSNHLNLPVHDINEDNGISWNENKHFKPIAKMSSKSNRCLEDNCLMTKDKEDHALRDKIISITSSPLLLNKSIDIVSRWVGKTILTIKSDPPIISDKYAFVRVSVIHNQAIEVISDVFGWTYSIIWDISFLPQVWLNWNRKSVVGFSFDNVTLNIVAYLFYSLFNVAFYAVPYIKNQFRERYPMRVNHVQPNDIFFAVYALTIEIILAIQCCIYTRAKGQRVSNICRVLVVISFVIVIVACILVPFHVLWWLDVFYIMSYLKLVITPLKYIPQLYVNYQMKSTAGFSMIGLLMDFTGGVMSLAQMFMLSANSNDWISIFTDFSKFGLGVLTIIFDLMFFAQHIHYHWRKR